jgi:hypothetical protein
VKIPGLLISIALYVLLIIHLGVIRLRISYAANCLK